MKYLNHVSLECNEEFQGSCQTLKKIQIKKYNNTTFKKLNTIKRLYKTLTYLPLCKSTIVKSVVPVVYLEPNGNIYHETFLQKIVNAFQPLTIFRKKFNLRCSTRF